jgi:HAD superfamily hydrolase (TIGR01509 family)
MSLQARQLLPSTTRQQRQQQAAAQRLVSDGQGRQWPAMAGSKRGSVSCTAFAAPSSLPRGDGVDYPNALSFLPDLSQQQASQPLDATPQPLPRRVEGAVDDPALANPLQRHLRLGTDWMGVIVEYEGIAVEDFSDLHTRAWVQLAAEEGKPQPFAWALRRAEGMKNEQVVQEVLLWSRAPMEVRRLCARKEEVFRELRGDAAPAMPPGTDPLLRLLEKHNVPVALACSAPEARVLPELEALGLSERLAAVVIAEDVARGRPDPEAVLLAAQRLGRPPIRCVLIGNANATVETARECGMAVVAVAGRTPVYELTAADLVVRSLEELSFVNLKQLFRSEDTVAFQPQEELEEESAKQQAPVITMERPW